MVVVDYIVNSGLCMCILVCLWKGVSGRECDGVQGRIWVLVRSGELLDIYRIISMDRPGYLNKCATRRERGGVPTGKLSVTITNMYLYVGKR